LIITEKLLLNMAVKVFFGDGEFDNENPGMTGLEFLVGTQWNF